MKRLAPVFLPFIMLGSLLLTSGVRAQTVISSQAPCTTPAGYCTTFRDDSGPIPTIGAFSFNAPRAGKALVTFHGSLYCLLVNTTGHTVVDVVSQITTTAAAAPTVTGPGGLRHAITWTPRPFGTNRPFFTTNYFNLASTRVVNITTPGLKTFYFKIARLRMDPRSECYVYNSAFTVVFAP